MKKRVSAILSILFIANLILPSLVAAEENKTIYKSKHYNAIAELYLPSLAKQDIQEQENSKKINEKNKELKEGQEKDIDIAGIGDVETLKLFYNVFASQKDLDRKPRKKIISPNTMRDLNIFCGDKADAESNLFSVLDHTQTAMGKIQLQKMLYYPTTDISELKKRQEIIKKLILDKKMFNELDANLKKIKKVESEFVWFFKPLEKEINDYFESLYFQFSFLQGLNKDPLIMELCHEHLNLSLSIPFLLATIAGGATGLYLFNRIDPVGLASTYAILSLFSVEMFIITLIQKATGQSNVIDEIIRVTRTAKNIQGRMIDLALFQNSVQEVAQNAEKHKSIIKKLPYIKQRDDQANRFLHLLKKNTFKGQPSFFSFQGRSLAAYKQMYDIKDKLVNQLKAVGQMDAYLSIAKLYKKHAGNDNAKYCFVEYLDQDVPSFEVEGFWHPQLNTKTVVPNDVELGISNRNIILTGPNAAGKSTILKAVTINLILAQSFGIAPAHSVTMTPFALINTYLNIADTIGKESLFQAEMNRAKKLIEDVKKMSEGEFSFIIMDEVFTGTNPKEGAAGAYGILKRLSKFGHHLSINATHFVEELSRLEKDTNGLFKNKKVYVNKNKFGRISYPYLWEDGITDQAIALNLLEQSGFDDEILTEAYNILNAA